MMSDSSLRTRSTAKLDQRWLAAIDRVLSLGIKISPAAKSNAINKVLEMVPRWQRGDCWRRIRHLRRASKIASDAQQNPPEPYKLEGAPASTRSLPALPWTVSDDERLLNWAGYEPVRKIAQRLGRSERAVRFRMCALGMSAKVTDGWSLRSLRQLLRVSPTRLRQLIGSGMMRVRDPRITGSSLAEFLEKNHASLEPSIAEKVANSLVGKCDAYAWERVADLFTVPIPQVQRWISTGQLKVLDPFVTDRSFGEFCKKHGTEINLRLIDPATAKWLVEEYGVPALSTDCQNVGRARKHALVVRTCECGNKIAGNAYFKHAKTCKARGDQVVPQAV
jgi:hypothetical protein